MWRELLFLFLSAGIQLPYSIHMGQPPHDFNLGLQSWWGSQSRSFVLFWQRVGYISLIDPSDALPATWILNRMTQKDLQPFYHIHLGGTLLKRLLIIFATSIWWAALGPALSHAEFFKFFSESVRFSTLAITLISL